MSAFTTVTVPYTAIAPEVLRHIAEFLAAWDALEPRRQARDKALIEKTKQREADQRYLPEDFIDDTSSLNAQLKEADLIADLRALQALPSDTISVEFNADQWLRIEQLRQAPPMFLVALADKMLSGRGF
jgi:hypothetical protein